MVDPFPEEGIPAAGSVVLEWLLATTVSQVVGWAALMYLFRFPGGLGPWVEPVFQAIYEILVGPLLGFSQWLVLRQYLRRAGWWVLLTIVGSALGWFTGAFVVSWLARMLIPRFQLPLSLYLATVPSGVVVGAVLGIFQWLVLRRQVHGSGRWIGANMFAWAMTWVVFGLTGFPIAAATAELSIFVPGIVFGLIHGGLYGTVTGIALLGLLRYPAAAQASANRPH